MRAPAIFLFARTSRCCMADSVVRNARAISDVCRPPSVRSVSATRASGASAGWQQVKISRSRSSGMELSSISSSSPRGTSASSSRTLSSSLRARRIRSIALFRAVVVIHAPGLRGSPRSGQTSSATRNASWTASSARSKSPRTRMSAATARPDSSRNRRSTASAGVATAGPPRRSSVRPSPRPRSPSRAAPRPCRPAWESCAPRRSPRPGSRTRAGRSRRASPSSPRTARR